ncbi:hypothetical protein BDQ12DRAFT_617950, partial [Crucibulum laeve]
FLAWPAIIFSINSVVNQHPLGQKEAEGRRSNLMLCVSALFASFIPIFVIIRS